jgi:hypothetical protein
MPPAMANPRYRNYDQAGDGYGYGYGYEEPEQKRSLRRVIVMLASTLGVVLFIGVFYELGVMVRHQPSAPPISAAARQRAALARAYLAIADPSDKQLNVEEDAYARNEKSDLTAAEVDLRDEVGTERQFDTQLAAIKFPAATESIAQALIKANKARFRVTLRQSRSKTLPQLQSLDAKRTAGDASVETEVAAIRKALGLPPESAS